MRGVEQNVWHGYLGKYDWGESGDPFQYSPFEILNRAQRRRLCEHISGATAPVVGRTANRVTDFSSWIGSLYRRLRTGRQLAEGKDIERQIFELTKLYARKCIPPKSDWSLIHRTPAEGEARCPFMISTLRVNEEPLWGIPDVVFKNLITGEILILEIKVTNSPIPSDGWPDLRAQLWAYGQIDEWRDAPKIGLVAEIWGKCPSGGLPQRRKILRWETGQLPFDEENRKLFEVYNGTYIPRNPFR